MKGEGGSAGPTLLEGQLPLLGGQSLRQLLLLMLKKTFTFSKLRLPPKANNSLTHPLDTALELS